jgi:hypothetical protein
VTKEKEKKQKWAKKFFMAKNFGCNGQFEMQVGHYALGRVEHYLNEFCPAGKLYKGCIHTSDLATRFCRAIFL